MERYQFSFKDGAIHVDGFPLAVKVIALDDPKATRLAHMALHNGDLEFALRCLEATSTTDNAVLREASWRMAVVTFIKCFDSTGRRSHLDAKVVYANEETALRAFRFFDTLRNKHIAHDENGYAQAHPGAIINGAGQVPKVPKAFTLVMLGMTLSEPDYGNLHLLIINAIKYVVAQYDLLADRITAELERVPYADLIARPSVKFRVPPVEELSKRRETP